MLEIHDDENFLTILRNTDAYNTTSWLNIRTYSNKKDGNRDIVIESDDGMTYYKLTQNEAEELIAAIQYVLMKERE